MFESIENYAFADSSIQPQTPLGPKPKCRKLKAFVLNQLHLKFQPKTQLTLLPVCRSNKNSYVLGVSEVISVVGNIQHLVSSRCVDFT